MEATILMMMLAVCPTKLNTLAAAGKLPDCGIMNENGVLDFAADGLLVNDYYINKEVAEYTDYAINDANEELLKRYKGQTITSDIYTKEAAGDPFPGTSETTEFTDDSMPKAFWYTEGNVGKPITGISKDASGNVSFSFMGGTTGIGRTISVSDLPESYYTIDGKPAGKNPSSLGKGLWVRKGYKVVK